MKIKDIPILKQKVLDILPITQAEIWKVLEIGSRDCSELITIMVGENLVKRTKKDKTFLIERLDGNGHENGHTKDKNERFSVLLSKSGKFSPCSGCVLVCDSTGCQLLTVWLSE